MNNNKGFASILVVGIIVFVVAVGSLGFYYLNNSIDRNVLEPTLMPATSSSTQNQQQAQQEIGSVTIKEILVKSSVDISPQQDATYDLKVAGGHYLLWTFANSTVVYDGKKVYQGNVDSIGLSKNGLHYAYAIRTNRINPGWGSAYATKDNDLYIDGRKIISSHNIQNINLSDDGQHYMFTSTINTSGYISDASTTIYKDEQNVYQTQGIIDGLNMSSDSNSYLASLSPAGAKKELIMNGKLIPNGLNGFSGAWASHLVYSPNNLHYAYSTPTDIIVDGQSKYKVKDGNLGGCLQVTDKGHYALCDYARGSFVVDGKLYSSQIIGGVSININQDATHYLTYNGQWSLDDNTITFKKINPQWPNYKVDVVENTFYIYSVVQ